MTINEFYSLSPFTEIKIGRQLITRVPGGWIFTNYTSGEKEHSVTSVFVPYSDEFKLEE